MTELLSWQFIDMGKIIIEIRNNIIKYWYWKCKYYNNMSYCPIYLNRYELSSYTQTSQTCTNDNILQSVGILGTLESVENGKETIVGRTYNHYSQL